MVVAPDRPFIYQRTLTDDARVLRQIFDAIDAASCPHTYNFHMHTVCSDGKLTPAALMEQVMAIGLRAFAITDHHSLRGYHQARAWLEDWRWRHPTPLGQRTSGAQSGGCPRLFTGVEINALLADTEVHLLGYGFSPDHPALEPYLQGMAPRADLKSASTVIQAIQAAGGLAVLAHPARPRYRLSADLLIAQAASLGIDGIETYYAYSNPDPWHSCPTHTPVIAELAHRYGLMTTCGTDTHGADLLRRL